MIDRMWTDASKVPKRVVVELSATEYQALEQLGHGPERSLSPAQLVRLVAVQLVREPY